MNNPQKGDTPLEVAGKTYTLRYNHLALIQIERALKKGIPQIMQELSSMENLRLETIVSLLWAGLQKHHSNMSFEQAADLLDEVDGGASAVMPVVGEAFQKAFTAPGTKGTNPLQKEGNGTGTPSLSNM